MINLLIDTCNSHLLIALTSDSKILSSYNDKLDKDLSVEVFPKLITIFDEAGIKPEDVDNIFVTVGPGSFTGIRIGVTIAKTYAWSMNKKIIPISSLELMASTMTDDDYIVPVIDARRGYVYAGIYDKNLNCIFNDTYIKTDELKDTLIDKSYSYIAYSNVESIDSLSPNVDILKVITKHINDAGVNPHSINPNYLKATEAEVKKNNNDSSN